MLEESVIYQEILQQGIARGVLQGERRGMADTVLRQLASRFGPTSGTTETHIRNLPVELLEKLGLDLLDFQGRRQVIGWLRRHGA